MRTVSLSRESLVVEERLEYKVVASHLNGEETKNVYLVFQEETKNVYLVFKEDNQIIEIRKIADISSLSIKDLSGPFTLDEIMDCAIRGKLI